MSTRRYLTIDPIDRDIPDHVIEFDLNHFGDESLGFDQEALYAVVKLQLNDHVKLINGTHVIRIE